jgi:hypothetical protein
MSVHASSHKAFMWMTVRESWSRRRRVVGKAEFTMEGANLRYVVTSLKRAQCKTKYLYEKVYCARGEMENRIKECQLDLYADRTSTTTMRANQLACGLRRALTCCSVACVASRCITPSSPRQRAALFASNCST